MLSSGIGVSVTSSTEVLYTVRLYCRIKLDRLGGQKGAFERWTAFEYTE